MINRIMSGKHSKYGYDYAVWEVSDINGSLPVYAVMRNQGEHDEKYFIVKAFTDKALALSYAKRLFEGKAMKYHGHEILKTPTDLGEENPRNDFTYEIYKDGVYIATALTFSTAKTYIDSNYNETYL